MIKTAKIQEIKNISPYQNSYGTTYYHHLVMDNGDKIDIGKKSECKVGWDLTYEIIGDPGQHEYTKAKSAKKEDGGFNNNKSYSKKGGNNNSFALSYAKDLCVAGKIELNEITKWATTFNQWMDNPEGKKESTPPPARS